MGDFTFGKDFLSPAFLLFARRLASTPPFPADQDGIKFDFATNQWILAPFGGGGEANTSSNVGTGAGLALPKVGVDLPFKSLVAGAGIVLTPTATEIEISSTATIIEIKSGSGTVSLGGNTSVTFNTNFTSVPNVVASLQGNVSYVANEKGQSLSVFDILVGGFEIRYDAVDGQIDPATFNWIATNEGNP